MTSHPPLLQALAESVQEVQREAARALGNLAANIVYGDMILRAGAQPHLLTLLRSSPSWCLPVYDYATAHTLRDTNHNRKHA